MKFRNPWIDPRVAELHPEMIRAYLTQHGWSEIGPAQDPTLVRFEQTTNASEAPTLFVPLRPDNGHGLQWMIELVGDLATWQGRFAGDVLSELLSFERSNGSNGPTAVPAAKRNAVT